MDYIPSKKFFIVFSLLLFLSGGIFAFAKWTSKPPPEKNDNAIEVAVPQKNDLPVASLHGEMVSTATLLKQAAYFDDLDQYMSATGTKSVINSINSEMEAEKENILGDHYSEEDILITDNNSIEAIKKYGNDLGKTFQGYRENEKPQMLEIDIIKKAIGDKDVETIKELDPYIDYYQTIIEKILQVEVPADAVDLHLQMLNAHASQLAVMEGFRGFNDTGGEIPASAAIQTYPDVEKAFFESFLEAYNFFLEKDIVYSPKENGYIFTLIFQKQK